MGKVFNDQIIKILCAKNLNKIQHDIGEPNLKPKCTCLRRGESYVVFLDREHRKQLQRQMGGMDLKMVAGETSLCTLASHHNKPAAAACSGDSWLNQTFSRRQTNTNASKTQARIRESVCKMMQHPMGVVNFLARHCDCSGKEDTRMTPSVFGPFVDEPLCGFIDRVCYCLCLMFGRHMEPLEPSEE